MLVARSTGNSCLLALSLIFFRTIACLQIILASRRIITTILTANTWHGRYRALSTLAPAASSTHEVVGTLCRLMP